MRWFAFPVFVVTIVICQQAGAASFDCANAAGLDEKAVCNDPRLSRLDDRLAAAYAKAKAAAVDGRDATEVRRIARDFMAGRQACGADAPCIADAYVAVLDRLRQAPDETSEDADTPPDHASPSVCVVILSLERQAVVDGRTAGDADALRSAASLYRRTSTDLHGGDDNEAQQMIASSVAFYDRLTPRQLSSAADLCLSAVGEDFTADE